MRYSLVSTSCGCGMPGLARLANAELLAKANDARAAKGRQRTQTTNVGRYVERKAPAVARKLRAVLRRYGRAIAREAARRFTDLAKDDTTRSAIIDSILASLASDDMGLDIQGELLGPMEAAFRRAAAIGATQVGMSIIDITAQVDVAAVAYAKARSGELIRDMAGTTTEAMRSTVAEAVEEGWSAARLQDAIEALGTFGEARAEMIARTELAFAHVQGNVQGWRESGEVAGKRWLLADTHPEPDECDEAAEAGVVPLEGEFAPGITWPPAHPRCCLPGTEVAPGGAISAHFTRWFQGEVVDISTARNHLAVTPNHPVLTQRGWVAAGALQVGDYVLEAVDPTAVASLVDPHHDDVPTRIEDVAGALLMAGGVATCRVPAPAEAFHGDGMPHGEVDVVRAACDLAAHIKANGAQGGQHLLLGMQHGGWGGLPGDGAGDLLGVGVGATACSGMCGGGHGSAGLGRHAGECGAMGIGLFPQREPVPAEQVAQRAAVAADGARQIDAGLAGHVPSVQGMQIGQREAAPRSVYVGPAADACAGLTQQAVDHLVRDGQLDRDLADRFAGLVSAAQVIKLGVRQYQGHVYNLSTGLQWYIAGGMLVHNCLCDVEPVLKPRDDD